MRAADRRNWFLSNSNLEGKVSGPLNTCRGSYISYGASIYKYTYIYMYTYTHTYSDEMCMILIFKEKKEKKKKKETILVHT